MKMLLAAAAFLVGLSAGAQAQIPLLSGPSDPSQLIATLNQVITSINATAYSQAFPTPSSASGGMSSVPNAITLTAAATGRVALIAPSTTADANAALGISPNGSGNLILFSANGGQNTGLLQFANAASFEPVVGLAVCPGYSKNSPNPTPPQMSGVVAGYLVFQDWLGRTHYVPSC